MKHQCRCVAGQTGSDCELSLCVADQPGVSLFSLFLISDATLRSFSASYQSSVSAEASAYLRELLFTFVDLDGDGVITKTELVIENVLELLYF